MNAPIDDPEHERRARRFVALATERRAAPLVPELPLRLASHEAPLWRDADALLTRDDLSPPYWAFAWAGGQALARYVLDHPESVRGRRVLAFACGSGLEALAAARVGAASVTAVDVDPLAVAATRLNAEDNDLVVEALPVDLVGRGGLPFDVVLAGDVCYEPDGAGPILRWLRALAAEGMDVLLGDPGRPWKPRDGLVALATYRVDVRDWLEDPALRATTAYRLLPDARRS